MLKQAEWCSASKDFKGAARMYVGAGRPERAVALLMRQQWWKELDRLVPKLDKDKPVLLYCASGRRSAAARSAMEEAGFKDVKHLEGGIGSWTRAGKPVVR